MVKPGRQSSRITCGPRLASIQLPAAPPVTALQHLVQIDAARLREEQRFARRQHIDHAKDLVGELDRLPGALFTDMGDGAAHGFEIGIGAGDVFVAAANHDAECALGRAFAAAADGRVEHGNALGVELFGDLDGVDRIDRCSCL